MNHKIMRVGIHAIQVLGGTLYSPIPLGFDWRSYRDSLCAGNWQQGTMLWLMLATTLYPTALHLGKGIGAIFAHRAWIDQTICDIMTQTRDRFVDRYGVAALETRNRDWAEIAFPSIAALHKVQDLLARKEWLAFAWSILLFAAFLALLIIGTAWLAHSFAMPQLCPAP